jgi:hypothetical protein
VGSVYSLRVHRVGTVLLLAAVLVGVGAACAGGDPPALPTGEAEQEIHRLVTDLYGADFAVGRVRCPAHVDQEEGNTFYCLATVAGEELPIRVRQTNDEGSVRINQAEALIPRAEAEDYVTGYASRHGSPVRTVSCGRAPVLIRRPGERITCAVVFETDAPGTARMQVVDVNRRIAMQSLTVNS